MGDEGLVGMFVDGRTIKQMADLCCPPQIAISMFEDIEMI